MKVYLAYWEDVIKNLTKRTFFTHASSVYDIIGSLNKESILASAYQISNILNKKIIMKLHLTVSWGQYNPKSQQKKTLFSSI